MHWWQLMIDKKIACCFKLANDKFLCGMLLKMVKFSDNVARLLQLSFALSAYQKINTLDLVKGQTIDLLKMARGIAWPFGLQLVRALVPTLRSNEQECFFLVYNQTDSLLWAFPRTNEITVTSTRVKCTNLYIFLIVTPKFESFPDLVQYAYIFGFFCLVVRCGLMTQNFIHVYLHNFLIKFWIYFKMRISEKIMENIGSVKLEGRVDFLFFFQVLIQMSIKLLKIKWEEVKDYVNRLNNFN